MGLLYTQLLERIESLEKDLAQAISALHDARLENSGQAARIEELKKGNEIITAAVCSGNSIEVERAIQERDAARAEVEELKKQMNQAQKFTTDSYVLLLQEKIKQLKSTRPEPSRLEIAAMAMQGLLLSSEYPKSVIVTDALWCADKLIAATKEGK